MSWWQVHRRKQHGIRQLWDAAMRARRNILISLPGLKIVSPCATGGKFSLHISISKHIPTTKSTAHKEWGRRTETGLRNQQISSCYDFLLCRVSAEFQQKAKPCWAASRLTPPRREFVIPQVTERAREWIATRTQKTYCCCNSNRLRLPLAGVGAGVRPIAFCRPNGEGRGRAQRASCLPRAAGEEQLKYINQVHAVNVHNILAN